MVRTCVVFLGESRLSLNPFCYQLQIWFLEPVLISKIKKCFRWFFRRNKLSMGMSSCRIWHCESWICQRFYSFAVLLTRHTQQCSIASCNYHTNFLQRKCHETSIHVGHYLFLGWNCVQFISIDYLEDCYCCYSHLGINLRNVPKSGSWSTKHC